MREDVSLPKWNILVNKETIDVGKIVSDSKISREGVERYKKMIAAGDDIGTITVVRHPARDFYAVLDGHHRYWAARETFMEKMNCIVIPDLVGLLHYATKEGAFQPPKEFTRNVRIPLKKLAKYLNEFLYDPEKML